MSLLLKIRVCVFVAMCLAPGLRAAPTYEVLAEFDRGPSYPKEGRLVQGVDGAFYGVLRYAGTEGVGAICKVTAAGAASIFVNFTGAGGVFPGSDPAAGLIVGSDGNFYGTTRSGGPGYFGTVFKLTPSGALTTLGEFTGTGGAAKGSHPAAELLVGSDGDFYGTTYEGGTGNFGTVFKLTPAGVLTTLAEFTGSGGAARGSHPSGPLVWGNDGAYYGTTTGATYGSVFKVTSAGVFTSLALFTGGSSGSARGSSPIGELALGNDGNFYGTAQNGGASGYGTVFKVTPAGVLTTLSDFTGASGAVKGRYPNGLLRGGDGAFYGTTSQGGAGDFGTVFRVTTGGVFTTLAQMSNLGGAAPGHYPLVGLIVGSDGAFYGTTNQGGASDHGVVFRVTAAGGYTSVVEFTGAVDPAKPLTPIAGMTRGGDGAFYGTSSEGGAFGFGTIFKITPGGALTTLVHFTGTGGAARGSDPRGGLRLAGDRNFYGATVYGGAGDFGSVFKMTPTGALTTLVEFTGTVGARKGQGPSGQLVEGSDGALYGTTYSGGGSDFGTIFKVTTDGVFTTLFEFVTATAAITGRNPTAGLAMDGAGDFYGTGHWGGANGFGALFKVTPAGALMPQVQFSGTSGAAKGSYPEGVCVSGAGAIFGTTESGGAGNFGTIFKMTPAGAITTLVEFTGASGAAKGSRPDTVLMQAGDGNFYGATSDGGILGRGSIFKMTPGGAFATLVDLSGSAGAAPGSTPRYGTPLLAPDGNLYGGAGDGGGGGGGVLWRVRLDHAPTVVTQPAGSVSAGGVTLLGTVTANGADAVAAFEYGVAPTLGFTASAVPSPVTGSSATVISALLTGLAPHTTYFFRARATNSEGTTVGDTLSSTTQNTYDVWKVEQFGGQSGDAFISGPGANPDRDALVNLLEYALGSVPTIAGDLLPDARLTDGYLTLTYTRPKDRSDLAYAVEVAPAPDRPWRSDLTAEVSRVDRGATETLQIRSTTPSVSVPGQVIRLRITLFPPGFP